MWRPSGRRARSASRTQLPLLPPPSGQWANRRAAARGRGPRSPAPRLPQRRSSWCGIVCQPGAPAGGDIALDIVLSAPQPQPAPAPVSKHRAWTVEETAFALEMLPLCGDNLARTIAWLHANRYSVYGPSKIDGTQSRGEPVNHLDNPANSCWPPVNHLRKSWKLVALPVKHLERTIIWSPTVVLKRLQGHRLLKRLPAFILHSIQPPYRPPAAATSPPVPRHLKRRHGQAGGIGQFRPFPKPSELGPRNNIGL
jgi:hypothetical protein